MVRVAGGMASTAVTPMLKISNRIWQELLACLCHPRIEAYCCFVHVRTTVFCHQWQKERSNEKSTTSRTYPLREVNSELNSDQVPGIPCREQIQKAPPWMMQEEETGFADTA